MYEDILSSTAWEKLAAGSDRVWQNLEIFLNYFQMSLSENY